MLLKNNKLFKLPSLMGGSFSGLDRLEIPHEILILKSVTQRPDNGNIQLNCQAKDGPEQKMGLVKFINDDRSKKDFLYNWFKYQIGKDIETIYNSEFHFNFFKNCPKCRSDMFESLEPKVATLANEYSKLPKQFKSWVCNNCNYKEKI